MNNSGIWRHHHKTIPSGGSNCSVSPDCWRSPFRMVNMNNLKIIFFICLSEYGSCVTVSIVNYFTGISSPLGASWSVVYLDYRNINKIFFFNFASPELSLMPPDQLTTLSTLSCQSQFSLSYSFFPWPVYSKSKVQLAVPPPESRPPPYLLNGYFWRVTIHACRVGNTVSQE